MVDASIAIKWVVAEAGAEQAWRLRERHRFLAPDLLAVECTNILWKKVRLGELTAEEASLACGILAGAGIELCPMRPLMRPALRLALALDHSAYDCAYLVLALQAGVPFATADGRLVRKVAGCSSEVSVPEIICVAV
ncbi:MAG: type II toxin-antitoxin system VapC family toxin [Acetobacteraceae bacterium]|nr:type II toxin-antitoxin system VapC family toxin [Acetobacteraceae bacterium]